MTAAKETHQEDMQSNNSKLSSAVKGEESATGSKNGRLSSLIARLRQGKVSWLVVEGYLAQELHTEEPVHIKKDSTLLGNVFAPKILVEGTLSGSAYARQVEVLPGGEIWGDVFTMALNISPGGTVQGWVSSLTEEDLDRLQQNNTLIDEAALASEVEALNAQVDNNFLTRNESQMESLHLLQMELAVTLAARYEMEQEFDRRLTEMAGEAYNKISILSDQLTAVRTDLTHLKKQLDEAQETIRQQKNQIDRQTNELTVARELMTDQNQELGDLRQRHQELRQHHDTVETEKAALETSLAAITKDKEELENRVENLETAHRSNLQYQAEQKDSLIRWQELAEVTENKAAELDTKLQNAGFQIEESSKTIDLLRSQRQEIEKELEKTLEELANLQGSDTRPLVAAEALAEATERINQLESDLAHAEQEYQEQIIWYKASLETSRLELEKAREESKEQSAHVDKLKSDLNQIKEQVHIQNEKITALQEETRLTRAEADRWKADLTDKENSWRKQTKELEQTITHIKSDKKNMQATLRESQIQLEASEVELQQYFQETKTQGERLAEIHAQLVERDLQLKKAMAQIKQAKTMIEKQNQALKQIKEVTSERIRALQAENTRLKQQK